MTPANTPATPPNFPETLLSFNKLSTSSGTTPPSSTAISSNDYQISSSSSSTTTTTVTATAATANHSLSSSPMNMTMMMMMDGTA